MAVGPAPVAIELESALRSSRLARIALRQASFRPSARLRATRRIAAREKPMEFLLDPQTWISLLVLTTLEIVLGIDNIIFISILAGRLPRARQASARSIGLFLAMITRILLLASLAWLSHLTTELFAVFGHAVTARDLILLVGGLFLLAKATLEIHENLEGVEQAKEKPRAASFAGVIAQILALDIVFSLDSVITAIGIAEHLPVMIAAIVIAVLVMMVAAGPLSHFVEAHPTVKMLALAFLLLIGMALVADGFHLHIPKGYVYFAMGFSVFVEMLNLRLRARRAEPVRLRGNLQTSV
jgi:predicted tellurium resistance membrane protein TerC